MGGFVGNLTGGLIGTSDAEKAAKKAREEAERQRKQYEADLEKQRQAAILDSNKALDNVTQVEVGGGDSYDALSSAGSKRKRKGGDSTSSALGIR